MTPKSTLTDTPDNDIIKALGKKLMHFNELSSGVPYNHRPLAIVVTHPDTGEMLGGLWGSTNYSLLYIDLLYLSEDLRRAGLGRQLIAQAEQEAMQRGC